MGTLSFLFFDFKTWIMHFKKILTFFQIQIDSKYDIITNIVTGVQSV